MGCLRKIILLIIVIAFFAFGGYSFIKNKINEYKNPSRENFVKTETNFGDFSNVPSDYQLSRNFNLFGYKKITAKYLPTGQKITIFDLKDEKLLSVEDFSNNMIDKKINDILNKTKDSIITFEDFQITQRGFIYTKGEKIPYIKFTADVKNVPFKNVTGLFGAYSTKNIKAKQASTKIIYTMTDTKAYNPIVYRNFIEGINL